MPVFEYSALKADGKRLTGVVTADSPREARQQLRGRDVFVTDIRRSGESERRLSLSWLRAALSGRKLRSLALMTRQFSTLTGSGLPLTEALAALIEQVEDKGLSRSLRDVREKVTKGYSLADALASHPAHFNQLYVGMVRAGEASGSLDEVLAQIAGFCQSEYRMRSRLKAILTYPCIMLVVGTGVVVFLLTFVVPRVTAVLTENKVPLPTSTATLVAIGQFMDSYWTVLVALALLAYLGVKAVGATSRGRWVLDSLKIRIPLVGPLLRKQAVARFSSTLSALLRSGLPALDALSVVREVVGNRVLAKEIDRIAEAVTAGKDLSSPLRASRVFPPMVAYMVATGEQSGQLDQILEKVAEELDEEVEMDGQALIALLEPALIVVMAVVVAFIVLSIVQPILELSNL